MQKVNVELNIPDGFEVAEGEQPRSVKEGEYFLDISGDAQGVIRPFLDKVIVLKKKDPEYKVFEVISDSSGMQHFTAPPPGKYVDIAALEEALDLARITESHWGIEHEDRVRELAELLK